MSKVAPPSKVATANLRKLKPYGDIMDDGTVQLAFTLPVEPSPEAREAAFQLVHKMGFDGIKIATMEKAAEGFAVFVVYANVRHSVDFTQIRVVKVEAEKRSREELDDIIREKVGRKLIVLGACTGYDAHTVGIDAIMNMKGFAGDYGLERYQWLDARNLGAQVLNEELLDLAEREKADAILVSKVVTQHNIHVRDLKDLTQRAHKRGLSEKLILIAGGPRVTHPLALECGFDAGFGVGTKPSEVASYIVEEFLRRREGAKKGSPKKKKKPALRKKAAGKTSKRK
ncbi:MAG TPA: OAM dimerization domain-containing protein [Bdellovibrionota bacterium]|nr:OAM dimerization domain-containing protein [Bdellovibrionota bacterium]